MQDLVSRCVCTLDESAVPDCSDDEERKLHETFKTASDFPSQDDKKRARYSDLTFDGSSDRRLLNNGFCVISRDNQSAGRLPNTNGFCVVSGDNLSAGRLANNGYCVISGDQPSAGRLANTGLCVISEDNQSGGRLANHGYCFVSAGDRYSAARLANHCFHVIDEDRVSDTTGCALCGLGMARTQTARVTRQSAATSQPTTTRTTSRLKEKATTATTRTTTTTSAPTITNNTPSPAVDKTAPAGRPRIVTRHARTTSTPTTKTASGKEEAATKRTTPSAAGKVMRNPSQAEAEAAATTTSNAAAAGDADETPERPLRTWSDIVRSARNPQMASFRTRLATLRSWPLIKPSPAELARAGLFHVRSTERESLDSVECFSCGERLHRWQESDDAMLEHARLSPDCHYVTQVLGRHLHNDVVRATSAQLDSRRFAEEFSQNSSEQYLNMAAA